MSQEPSSTLPPEPQPALSGDEENRFATSAPPSEVQGYRSLRTRLLALTLGTILISLLAATLVAADVSRSLINQAQSISSQSLRTQAQNYLLQLNAGLARQSDFILDRAMRDANTIATAAQAATAFEAASRPAAEIVSQGPEGQYLNTAADISSVFVPNTQAFDQAVERHIEQSEALDLVLPAVQRNNPNAAAIYLGTTTNVTRY
jgi:hypothetical protein